MIYVFLEYGTGNIIEVSASMHEYVMELRCEDLVCEIQQQFLHGTSKACMQEAAVTMALSDHLFQVGGF
jgi:hypothetical protein